MASFIITKSYVENDKFGQAVEVQRLFAGDKGRERLLNGEGTHFKLFDDDGNLYFTGKCLNDSSFSPLDDYGVAFGCTYMQYRNADGTYSIL